MADAAAVGRTTLGLERLAEPPARVWAGIAAELELPADVVRPPSRCSRGRGRGGAAASRCRPARVAPRRSPTARAGARRGGRPPRRGIGGIVATVQQAAAPRIVARAELAHLPGWSGSSGRAGIEQYSDGRRVAVVTTNLHAERDRTGTRCGSWTPRRASGSASAS